MDIYGTIREKIEAIPIIDDHSHVVHHNIGLQNWEGPYPVLPLARLLLDFNTLSCFAGFSMTEEQAQGVLLGHFPPEEQKRLLVAPHVKNRSVYCYLMRGLRETYGLDVWEINADNFDAVNAALEGSWDNYYALLDKIFTHGNVKCSVLNLWANVGYSYMTDYRQRLTDEEKTLDKKYFVFSNTVGYYAIPPFSLLAENYARDFGMKLDTLADYGELIKQICRWSVKERGARAFKNTEMYFRRPDYRKRSYEEAAKSYKPERTSEDDIVLSDYVAYIVMGMAAELNVPVQIHTGSLWGEFAVGNVGPEHLTTAIKDFPETRFVLLHGGDPFYGTMALMGALFPNVYVNMSVMPNMSYDDFRYWLGVFLDRVPSQKITLGWDEFAPELVAGDIPYTRDVLTQVFADKIEKGQYSIDLAMEIAHDIMHRSAEKLYKIP